MIRILIADDHPVVRRGLVQILEAEEDLSVGGEAGDGEETLELLSSDGWDAVVLDLSMPGPSGLELLRRIAAERPELPVLVLTVHPEEQYGLPSLRAGAAGYLNKASAPEHLVEALRTVLQGERYLSPELTERLLRELPADTGEPPHRELSPRERQVMLRIAEGQSTAEIAEELEISPKTVSTYRSRLLRKLELESNAEIARYALEHGLLL